LTRSRINDQLHVIPDSDPGSRLSRDTFGLALPPMYFLFWQKEAKPVSQVKSPGCILRSAGLRTYPLNCWPWAFAKTCGKKAKRDTGIPPAAKTGMTYWFFHIPGLTRSRINDQLHVIRDPDPGSRLSRDTCGLALSAVYFCFGKKEQKP
jgi:hypothetical protein